VSGIDSFAGREAIYVLGISIGSFRGPTKAEQRGGAKVETFATFFCRSKAQCEPVEG
jgi:hypothetical protein